MKKAVQATSDMASDEQLLDSYAKQLDQCIAKLAE